MSVVLTAACTPQVKADRDESSPYAAMLAAQDVAVRCKVSPHPPTTLLQPSCSEVSIQPFLLSCLSSIRFIAACRLFLSTTVVLVVFVSLLLGPDPALLSRSSALVPSTSRSVAPVASDPGPLALVAKPLSAPWPVLASRSVALRIPPPSLPTPPAARAVAVVVVCKLVDIVLLSWECG